MNAESILKFLQLAEQLKCNTRHCETSSGRKESVAEHCFSLVMFAWLLQDDFPDLDMEKVMHMCLVHDMGEAVTGDIPCFEKTEEARAVEGSEIRNIAEMLDNGRKQEFLDLHREMEENKSKEARLFHVLDKMEAVIQHNEADISTWLPLEYELQMNYGVNEAREFTVTGKLRDLVLEQSRKKIMEKNNERERA